MTLPAFTNPDTGEMVYVSPLGVSVVTQREPGVTWILFERGHHQAVAEDAEQVSITLWEALRAIGGR